MSSRGAWVEQRVRDVPHRSHLVVAGQHPDVEIYLSQPGLGLILRARVLAEFGDDPHRYTDSRTRKNYSGMAPITKPLAPNGSSGEGVFGGPGDGFS